MAYTITWEEVTALAPELASVSSAGQAQILAQVQMEVAESKWGSPERAKTAAIWLARHMATFRGGSTAGLSSISVGGVSKSFAGASESDFAQTKYGKEYLRLLKLWMPRFLLTSW